jgi:SAM-dependent methyltransferase
VASLWQKSLDSYDGLIMRCAPGTHEAAMNLLRKHVTWPLPTLDLASGSGAFLARLRDHGFTDLDAGEIDERSFAFPDLKPRHVDLNLDFASQIDRRYGLISALEILEHLDSPRHFLKQVHALLQPGGYLLLSTPNIANWAGRLRFLLRGEHRQFQEHDYHYQRHISPTTDIQMKLMFKEIGLRLVDSVVAGSFFGPLKRLVLGPVLGMARLCWGPVGCADVRIYLLQQTDPDRHSPGADSLYFQKMPR